MINISKKRYTFYHSEKTSFVPPLQERFFGRGNNVVSLYWVFRNGCTDQSTNLNNLLMCGVRDITLQRLCFDSSSRKRNASANHRS